MITIAAAEPSDIATLVDLLEETDRFYGTTEFGPRDQREAAIRSALFDCPVVAFALLARDGDLAVGLAAYSFLWPAADLARSLFLKELYVSDTHRRSGVGRHLMRALCEIATETGCGRVEWQTDSYNAVAQRFYGSLRVSVSDDKVFYRIQGAEIQRIASING